MNKFKQMMDDYMHTYEKTSKFKDGLMLEISLRKPEFEKNLDEMWAIYMRGNPAQIVEYNKGVDRIKKAGFKVLRNPAGKHKIITR